MAHRLKIKSITAMPKADVYRNEGHRVVIVESVDIDYSIFRKTPGERERLKNAKKGIVTTAPPQKTRGGWQWRMRRRLKKEGLSYVEIERLIAQRQEERKNDNRRTA